MHSQLSSQLPFSRMKYYSLSMCVWNPLNAPGFLASLTWQQHLRHTLPFVLGELAFIYLATGFYIKVEIKYDLDHLLNANEWLLWLLGLDPAEL